MDFERLKEAILFFNGWDEYFNKKPELVEECLKNKKKIIAIVLHPNDSQLQFSQDQFYNISLVKHTIETGVTVFVFSYQNSLRDYKGFFFEFFRQEFHEDEDDPEDHMGFNEDTFRINKSDASEKRIRHLLKKMKKVAIEYGKYFIVKEDQCGFSIKLFFLQKEKLKTIIVEKDNPGIIIL